MSTALWVHDRIIRTDAKTFQTSKKRAMSSNGRGKRKEEKEKGGAGGAGGGGGGGGGGSPTAKPKKA